MPFNVESFRGSMRAGEPISPAHFEARIFSPPGLLKTNSSSFEIAKTLSFRCQSATSPGKTLETLERRTYGPIRKIAYKTTYPEVTLTFVCSSSMEERKFFEDWFKFINAPEFTDGVYYGTAYYDDYVTNIPIVLYDKQGNERFSSTLVEAYPLSMTDLTLDWSTTNQLLTFSVTFAYRFHISKVGIAGSDFLGDFARGLNLIQSLKNLKTLAENPTALLGAAKDAFNNITGLKSTLTNGIGAISGMSTSVSGFTSSLTSNASSLADRASSTISTASSTAFSSLKKFI